MKKKQPRTPREDVLGHKVAARHQLHWSRWQHTLSPEVPSGQEDRWFPMSYGPGYRKRSLFNGETTRCAVYEIAVQRHSGCKMFVVYFRTTCSGFGRGWISWDNYLLRETKLRAQVKTLVGKGWSVFVRRACVEIPDKPNLTADRLKRINCTLNRRYDYAWRKNTCGRKHFRKLIKTKQLISDDTL